MDPLAGASQTFATNKAGLAAGTTTTLSSANQMDYAIGGKAYRKAAAVNEATPVLDALTGAAFVGVAANKGSVYSIYRNAGGDLKVAQGEVVDLDAAGAFTRAPNFAGDPADLCFYGYILVKVAAGGATWTFGASNLAGPPANTTITYVDCLTKPHRPQIS